MKTDYLKNLGITDQSVIDQIMAENGRDVAKAKGELDTYKTKVTDLENDIKTKDATIATLQTKADMVDGLNQKVTQLETDKTNLTNELNTKVAEIQKTHDRENKVRDAKAKNVKAVMALLDPEKDIDEQLTALKAGEDTAFLFGETHSGSPAGTQPNNPPSNGGNGGTPPTGKTLGEAIAAKFNSK